MARKAISDATQTSILLKSRRSCCLCFWLIGEDEVKKGQLAHLDGDNENASEENLVFLCLEHHDEYDSIPRLSKKLREQEVRTWRNELYREMEYRFRTLRKHRCELTLRLRQLNGDSNFAHYCGEFWLKNTGESEIRSPVVSIRLPDGMHAPPNWDAKTQRDEVPMRSGRSDLFEPDGRIATVAPIPVLLRDHSVAFCGLSGIIPSILDGTTVPLQYRVDGEGMTPVSDVIEFRYASQFSELKPSYH